MDGRTEAEDAYSRIHDLALDLADEIQPIGQRSMLPEPVVIAVATTIVVALSTGFFGKIGEDLAGKLREFISRGPKLPTAAPEDLIAHLDRNLPAMSRSADEASEIEEVVYRELVEVGFSDANSRLVARKSIEIVLRSRPR